jgi:tripartite-type tricarboxylate transporter receptor subunit TctC
VSIVIPYSAGSPTMAEQGFAEAQVTPWFGIVVPVGTPGPIVDRISKALEAALATPDVRQKLDTADCEPKSAMLGQFADIIKADVAVWGRVIKDAGIRRTEPGTAGWPAGHVPLTANSSVYT